MEFRRSGQLDGRRRRVLMEEIASPTEEACAAAGTEPAGAAASGPVRAYDPTVLTDRQPRITDLIPVRPLAVSAVLAGWLASLGLLGGLHALLEPTQARASGEFLAPLDLTQPTSLACWTVSVWLAWAAGLALLIFRIRAHRVDDYQGRYRIWLWAAVGLVWLSLDTVARLHVPLGWVLVGAVRSNPTGGHGPLLAWMAGYFLLFGTLALRLVFEIRCSFPSLATFVLALGTYLAAGMFRVGWLETGQPRADALLVAVLPLIAHGLVALAVVWYARHVYLDAAGRLLVPIESRSRVSRKRPLLGWLRGGRHSPGESLSEADRSTVQASPGEVAGAASSPAADAPRAAATAGHGSGCHAARDGEKDQQAASSSAKLSRAERRRLQQLARSTEHRRAA